MRDIERTIMSFGLSDKEAKIYVSLLELGEATAHTVAKESGINRSTAYVILEALAKEGFVSISQTTSVRTYKSASPKRIIQRLEEELVRQQALVSLAKQVLPSLVSDTSLSHSKSKAHFYEGIEGIKSAFEDTLTSRTKIHTFASMTTFQNTLPDFLKTYFYRRMRRGIQTVVIFPDNPESLSRVKNNRHELRTTQLISAKRFGFTPEIKMYDNKTVILSIQEKFALVIESKEVTDAMRKIFELAWLGAKSIRTKK